MFAVLRTVGQKVARLLGWVAQGWQCRRKVCRDVAYRRHEDTRLRGLQFKPEAEWLESWEVPNTVLDFLQYSPFGSAVVFLTPNLNTPAIVLAHGWSGLQTSLPQPEAAVSHTTSPLLDPSPAPPAPSPTLVGSALSVPTPAAPEIKLAEAPVAKTTGNWGLNRSIDEWLVEAGLAITAARQQRQGLATGEPAPAAIPISSGGAGGALTLEPAQPSSAPGGGVPSQPAAADLDALLASLQSAPRQTGRTASHQPLTGPVLTPGGDASAPVAGPTQTPIATPVSEPGGIIRVDGPHIATLQPGFAQQPLIFEANAGQADPSMPFLARGAGYTLGLSATEAALALTPRPADGQANPVSDVVRLQFVGANPDAVLQGVDELPSRSNYFRNGEHPLHITDAVNFGAVIAQGVYPGIDIRYHATAAHQLEYDLVVSAGADLSRVQVAFRGASSMSLDGQGRLLLNLPGGQLVHESPVLYQDIAGVRQNVTGRFFLTGADTIGFQAEGYDRDWPLVLDPVVSYSSYLGGSSTDVAYATATDLSGNLYVTGVTSSVDFPTLNPYQAPSDGSSAFVSKFTPSGSLIYSTYLGGTGMATSDLGYGIATDATGAAYIAGYTSDSGYPTTTGAFQTAYGGGVEDSFVSKLSPAGNALMYSSLIGGSAEDRGFAVAVDPQGYAVVTGRTLSSNFPTTGGAYDTTYGGSSNYDMFVTRFLPDGSGVVYSTYVGGAGTEEGNGVAVDLTGNAWIAGYNTGGSFPTTGGVYQSSSAGAKDAVIAKFTASGSLSLGTYLGGVGDEVANAIAVNAQGQAFVTGQTFNVLMGAGFPTTGGAYQTTLAGNSDAFISKFSADAGSLLFSTLLGGGGMLGAGDDVGRAIAVDYQGDAWITGETSATSFPTANATQSSHGGGTWDAFVTRLNSSGSSLLVSTYLGGSGDDKGHGIALDLDNNGFVVGETASTNFPTAGSPFQGSSAGSTDAFLTKYVLDADIPTFGAISSDTGSSGSDQITTDQTLSISGTGTRNSTITINRADYGDLGTTSADNSGNWSYDSTSTSLAEGVYAFTATGALNGSTSAWSNPFLVTIDRTAPTVTLTTDASTTVLKPYVRVVATDLNGLANGTTILLDVDLNNDGDFADASETGNTSGTLTDNIAILNVASTLSTGTTVRIRARVTDKAGNEATTAAQSVSVTSSVNTWPITDALATTDALLGSGPLQAGNLNIQHTLDLDLSPGTAVGGMPSLSYNAERVDVRPVISATLQSDNNQALPATITAQLTWNGGSPQSAQNFSTTGMIPGDTITVAQQVSSAVTSSGRYPWSLTVTMSYDTPVVKTLTGVAYVVAEGSSVVGAGWTLGGLDKLVDVSASPAGKLRVDGSGNWSFFTASGGGNYTSPAGEGGTLASVGGGGFQYTAPDGSIKNYDSGGLLTTQVSADGFATITWTYAGSDVTKIETPDGGVTTLTYSAGLVDTIQTGSRTVTLTHTGSDLTKITNPDSGVRTLTYDGAHRLTKDEFANLSTTYAYASYELSGSTPSGGGAVSVTPAQVQGLSALVGGTLEAKVTDALSHTTRSTLDGKNQVLRQIQPGGAVIQQTYDNKGWLKTVTDALNRTTTFTRDNAGYVTEEKFPDANTKQYAYQTNFHALTTYTDERGGVSTVAYDGGGHPTRQTDALGNATVLTWQNGLLQTVTDPLNHTTTYGYDSARRLESAKDAASGIVTLTYDSNGNVATTKDQLGRVTTFTNDALGRVTVRQDAAGGLWTTTYNGAGLVTSEKDALGRTTSNTYDGRGLLTKRVEAVGNAAERSQVYSYNGAGQQTATRDGNGAWTSTSYDAAGRPQTTTDALGNTQVSEYDLAGQQTGSRDALGRRSTSEYNSRGWVTRQTDALGNSVTSAYDAAGNLTDRTDARGTRSTYAYDALNRQTGTTEAVGTSVARTMTSAYDAVGNVSSSTDWLGNLVTYAYDSLNRQTGTTEAAGSSVARTMTAAYDAVGNVTSETDWRGTQTTYAYDSLNRHTGTTDGAGGSLSRTATVAYDAISNATSQTDWLARISSATFDALNRVTVQTQAVGTGAASTVTAIYDGMGRAAVTVDPLAQASQTGFDALGRSRAGVSPAGNLSRTQYDAVGNLRVSVDALGNKTETTFDALNRPIRVVNALGGVTSYVYDANGNRTVEIDARGNRVTYTYDALDRQVARADQLNHVTSTVYDAGGNVTVRIDALGNRTTMTYDGLNRQVTVKEPTGGVVTTAYDASDNVVSVTNQLGKTTTHTYDSLNRRTKTEDANNGVVTYLYDAAGNQTGLIDPVGNRTTFVYDSLNRKTEEKDPLNKSLTYAYDTAGQMTSQTDRLGQRRDYTSDADGRRTVETWIASNGSTVLNRLTYTYDANSNLLTAADQNGTYTYTYDALNRAATQKDVWSKTLTFSYDAVGNRVQVNDSLSGVLTSVYDAANNLTTRKFGGSGQTPLRIDFTYTNRNELLTASRYSDLAGSTLVGTSTYGYDAVGNMTRLQHKDGSATNIANYTWTYDAANRITSEKFNGGAPTTYTYDNTNQLTNDGTTAYTYDANGNRTMAGYETGSGNRMTNDGVYTYTYNDEGNLTKKSKAANDETWTYGYDNRNQLTTIEKRSQDGGTLLMKATYTYEVFNQRVQSAEWTQATGTVTARYSLENGNVWADLDGSSALTMRHLFGDQVDQIFARISSGGTAAWYLPDRLGSVRNMVDGTGALSATLVYDGYGNITTNSAPTFVDGYGFTGGARWYGPVTGRWNTQDPIRWDAGDYNLYRYVSNSPANKTDPTGLEPGDNAANASMALLGLPKPPPLVQPTKPNELSDAFWGEIGHGFMNVVTGAWHTVHDFFTTPIDTVGTAVDAAWIMTTGTSLHYEPLSYSGQANLDAMGSPTFWQNQLGGLMFGQLWGFGQGIYTWVTTGDPTQYQQQSGSFAVVVAAGAVAEQAAKPPTPKPTQPVGPPAPAPGTGGHGPGPKPPGPLTPAPGTGGQGPGPKPPGPPTPAPGTGGYGPGSTKPAGPLPPGLAEVLRPEPTPMNPHWQSTYWWDLLHPGEPCPYPPTPYGPGIGDGLP